MKEKIFDEFIRNGYSKQGKNKVWNVANRSFLHLTPELSKGFLKMMDFEPYKKNIFDREVNLIDNNIKDFIKKIGNKPFNLIDIGCGNGDKAKVFIKSLKGKVKIRYCPVSSDKYLVNYAIRNIKKEGFKNIEEFKPYIEDYNCLEQLGPSLRTVGFQRNVILLHGSILASYDINEFLFTLSRGMFVGDYILIGNGIRKGERLVNLKLYKDKVFDKWFIDLMKLAGFKKGDVKYDARFGNSRVEAFYKLQKNRVLRSKGKKIEFKKGDEVTVFILYKYFYEELEKFFKMYFSKVDMVKDKEDEYVLALCKK